MYRICIFLMLGLSLSVFADEGYRLFKDEEGREIRGKLVKVDARSGKVTVQREGGRKVTVPSDIFSAPDQAYIKEWLEAQDFLSKSKVRITIEKRKGKVESKRLEVKRPKAPQYYDITIANKSAQSFSNLSLEYCIYKVTDFSRSSEEKVEVVAKRHNGIGLSAGKKFFIETEKVALFRLYDAQTDVSTDAYGSSTYSTSYNKKSEDDVKGVWLKLTYKSPQGNSFVRELCLPDNVRETFRWKSAALD
ncbi:hypothetical protein P4B35_08420 [Pontiellaceae bacterium B12227]|nr:hypothetical protein [Pontiellaceae bacterium B12227]